MKRKKRKRKKKKKEEGEEEEGRGRRKRGRRRRKGRRIFCRKKSCKGTLDTKNTFTGNISSQKKKKDVGEIEGLGEGRKGRMKKEEEGRRRSKRLAKCFANKNRRMVLSNFFRHRKKPNGHFF
jgi:hypothetical protein